MILLPYETFNNFNDENWKFLYGACKENTEKSLYYLEAVFRFKNEQNAKFFISLSREKNQITNKIDFSTNEIEQIILACHLHYKLENLFFKEKGFRLIHAVSPLEETRNTDFTINKYIKQEDLPKLLEFSEVQLFQDIQKVICEDHTLNAKNRFWNGAIYKQFINKDIEKLMNVLETFDLFSIDKNENIPCGLYVKPKSNDVLHKLTDSTYERIIDTISNHVLKI